MPSSVVVSTTTAVISYPHQLPPDGNDVANFMEPFLSRALRVCTEDGCPELVTKGRCADHARERERQRGSAAQRGYDARHKRIRARLLRDLIPGAPCPRCNQPMWHDQPLDAGHSVDLRDDPTARADRLEHASCNRGWRHGTSR